MSLVPVKWLHQHWHDHYVWCYQLKLHNTTDLTKLFTNRCNILMSVCLMRVFLNLSNCLIMHWHDITYQIQKFSLIDEYYDDTTAGRKDMGNLTRFKICKTSNERHVTRWLILMLISCATTSSTTFDSI